MATDDALRASILAAHAKWSGEASERFPVNSDWEPPAAELGTKKGNSEQGFKPGVPGVPTVPSEKQYRSHCATDPEAAAAWALWVERAAIREYDGCMSRAEAEVRTALELGPCPR